MKLYYCFVGNECEYDEDNQNLLERNITLEPNIGSLTRIGNGEYKYYAPVSTPGDSALVVTVNYEDYNWYCWAFKSRADSCQSWNICSPYGLDIVRDYATDSIIIAWDSLDVKVEPDTIYPGDTAQVVIKKRLPDGTLVDFDTTQTYEVGMLDGCIFGNIVAGAESGSHIIDVSQPIYFIADTSADTSGAVLLRAGLTDPVAKSQNKNNLQKDLVESDCFVGWLTESYDDVTVVKDNPLEIITPTKNDTNWISAVPQMPDINCKAKMKNYNQGEVTFEWEFWVRYVLYRHDFPSSDTLCRRTGMIMITGTSTAINSDTTSWMVPFNSSNIDSAKFESKQPEIPRWPGYGGDCDEERNAWTEGDSVFIGGYVFVQITARNSEGKIIGFVQQNSGMILGENPEHQSVIAYTNPLDFRAIIIHESGKQQFNIKDSTKYYKKYHYNLPGWQYNKKGYPVYGPPNGYGLAQIDNPGPDEMDLWNWKYNVDDGRIVFNNAKTRSMNYIQKYNADVVDSIFYMNAYEIYNSNNQYWNMTLEFKSFIFIWYPVLGWKENPNRGSQNYGKVVYNIFKQLQ